MRKMGNFRGLPVFIVTDSFEWAKMRNEGSYEEKVYVYATGVYYKWHRIAAISGDTLINFDEDLFNVLRRNSWGDDGAQLLANATGSAETRPQEEEEPVNEPSEPTAADEFMAHWSEYIDNEIAMLKSNVAQLEDEFNAVG